LQNWADLRVLGRFRTHGKGRKSGIIGM
jgi:hypothetical protein